MTKGNREWEVRVPTVGKEEEIAGVCFAGLAAEPVEESASLDNQVATLRLRVTGLESANSAQSAEMEIMQTNMANMQVELDEMIAERQPALVIEMCKAALEDNWLELPKAIKDNIQDFPPFDVEFIDSIQDVSLDPPPADPVLLAIARLTKTDWLIDLYDTRNEGAHPHGTVAQTENVLQRANLASSAAKIVLKRLPNYRFSKTQPLDPTDLLNELSQEWDN